MMPDTRTKTEWTEWDSTYLTLRCACGKHLDFSAAIFGPEMDAFSHEGHTVKVPARWSMICPQCFRGHFKIADPNQCPPPPAKIPPPMPLNYGGFRMPGEKQPWTIFELRAFFYGVLAGTFGIGIATIIALHFLRK